MVGLRLSPLGGAVQEGVGGVASLEEYITGVGFGGKSSPSVLRFKRCALSILPWPPCLLLATMPPSHGGL